MVAETGELTGIINWELSRRQARSAWAATASTPLLARSATASSNSGELRGHGARVLGGNRERRSGAHPDAIQTSFIIGTVLDALDTETEGGFNHAVLRALPTFIKYRIPALRGDKPPYGE